MEKLFGTINGEKIYNVVIKNEFIEAEISSYGATLVSLKVPNKNGGQTDIVLGYDTLEEYQKNGGFFGATVGRFANRIGGGKFTLDGKTYTLYQNNGSNTLHGGKVGFDKRVWSYSAEKDSVTFSLVSPDGEEGFPGELLVSVTYDLTGPELEIRYHAVSDKSTPVSLTNHSYFNVAGHNSGAVYDQTLTLFANAYTPCDNALIPTGEIRPVDNTVFDLRRPTKLGDVLNDPSIASTKGFDHNFVLDKSADMAAILYSAKTGIRMECETTLEGIQIYTAGALNKVGKGGAHYSNHQAVCLETQHFPDAVNKSEFPSAILHKGDVWEHRTSYIFTVE